MVQRSSRAERMGLSVQPPRSLVDLLRRRAAEQPGDRAYVFVSDRGAEQATLTFAELELRAEAVAARLAELGRPGERALLLFASSLDFIVAYFSCLLAGVIPVPLMPPRRNSRDDSAAIVANCSPRFAITNSQLGQARPDIVARFQASGIEWIVVDSVANRATDRPRPLANPGPEDIAFLQYTSGSTSEPKGVMVTHGNLLANLEMIRRTFGNTRRSTYANWVPLYHDMGLIANVLQSLYVGALCVLSAPVTFIQRPVTWLRSIHNYRAEVAGAPNFAFDLCVERVRPDEVKDLDLSCWKFAFNGAEPVRADTIDRFAAAFGPCGFDHRAMRPLYGMAEATVLISGGSRGSAPIIRTVCRSAFRRGQVAAPASDDDAHRVVGCGRNVVGQSIAIVHPETRRRLGADQIGEIWVNGPHVCRGYWHNPEATRSAFQTRIEGEDERAWLRSGDLGFLDEQGELFITGRIKDVIIVRGINHYPQDIESTVYGCHPALRRHCGATFSVLDENAREKVVLVQEVERAHRHRLELEDILGSIREAVANEHEIALDAIVLVRPGTIPKTTSGKVQRSRVRALWLANSLDVLN
jgi:acyl-CoA synthetase (AMP-forming)/AMP-acid ligase II